MHLPITSRNTSTNSLHLAVEHFAPAATFVFEDVDVGDICVSANGFAFFAHSGQLAKAFDLIAHGYDASVVVAVLHPAAGILFFDVSVRRLATLAFGRRGENAKAGEEFAASLEPDDLVTQAEPAGAGDPAAVPEGGKVGEDSYKETPSMVEQAWGLFETFGDKSFVPSYFDSRYEKEDYSFKSSSSKGAFIDPADINMVAPPEIPAAKYLNVFRSDAHERKAVPLAQILAERVMPMLSPEDIRCVFDAMMEAPRLEREVVEVVEVPEPKAPNPYENMHVTWADLPVKPARDPDPPEVDDPRRSKHPEEKRNVLDLEVEFRIARYRARKARAKATVLKLKCKPIVKTGWLAWLWKLIPGRIREPVENRVRSVLGFLSMFWPWVPAFIRLPTERRVLSIRRGIELAVDRICEDIKKRVYTVRDTIELRVVRFRQQLCDRMISIFSLPMRMQAPASSRAVGVVAGLVPRHVLHSSSSALSKMARSVKEVVSEKFRVLFGQPEPEEENKSWLSSLWDMPWRVKDRVERKIMSYIPSASF